MPATALRLAVPSWAEDDGAMAPWAVPATGGAAALVGAWATLLLAHRHASRLRFNALAGAGAAVAAASVALLAASNDTDGTLLQKALPAGADAALALLAPRTLPAFALCAALVSACATLAVVLLTAPRAAARPARRSSAKPALSPPPRGRARQPAAAQQATLTPSDSFTFEASPTTTRDTPKFYSRAAPSSSHKPSAAEVPARSPSPPVKRGRGRPSIVSPLREAPAASPAASPVASPVRRGRASKAAEAPVAVASPRATKGKKAAAAAAPEAAPPPSLLPTSGFASSRYKRG